LRINEELRRKLGAAAKERQISTNQLMRQLLEDGLETNAKPSFESRLRNLEDHVQRMGSQRLLLDEAEWRQRDQEEGGGKK
jgi:hypothetical protein